MYNYHFREWLSFFYFYCMFGWCFESAYVSLKKRHFVNRGFLKGPWLPLYGCGAILVLWLTLPFQEQPVMVCLVGMLGATILEYLTGELMVRLFKVRYWDYSNQKFQYQGHICLTSSIAWGFLSLFMVYVVQKSVEQAVFWIHEEIAAVLVILITACMAWDFSTAFHRAMDLRRILIQAEQICMELEQRAMQKKRLIEATAVFTREAVMETVNEKKEEFIQSRDALMDRAFSLVETRQLEEKMEQLKERMARSAEQLLMQNPGSRFMIVCDYAAEIRERLKNRKERDQRTD